LALALVGDRESVEQPLSAPVLALALVGDPEPVG
jgi:hypothetical protein